MADDNARVFDMPNTPGEIAPLLESHRAGYRNGYEDGLADAAKGRAFVEDYYTEDEDAQTRLLNLLGFVLFTLCVLWLVWHLASQPYPEREA